jgi:hypothetical protein
VDRTELPFPDPVIVFMRDQAGGLVPVQMPDSVLCGLSVQYIEGLLQPGGRVRDSEGPLCFDQDGVTFYADSGRRVEWRYDQIKSYSVNRRLISFKLTLQEDGSKARFKIGRSEAGRRLIANVMHIFAAKRIPEV